MAAAGGSAAAASSRAAPLPRGPTKELAGVVEAHVVSFDAFCTRGMRDAVQALAPVEVTEVAKDGKTRVRHAFRLVKPRLEKPVDNNRTDRKNRISRPSKPVLPSDCRQASTSYCGAVTAKLEHVAITEERDGLVAMLGDSDDDADDGDGGSGDAQWRTVSTRKQRIPIKLGDMPIMVQSAACTLRGLPPKGDADAAPATCAASSRGADLPACREEPNEMGGYFILNGIERIIRLLIVQRRHYVMALRRSAYRKRGPSYTDMATAIRCVRPDQSGITVRLHYLSDGSATFGFSVRRREYFIPLGVMLKALLATDAPAAADPRLATGVSDREIFVCLVGTCFAQESGDAAFVAERAEAALRDCVDRGLRTPQDCLRYIGRHFLPVLATDDNNDIANIDRLEAIAMHREQPASVEEQAHIERIAGRALLSKYVFVHLARGEDKFHLLVHMAQKLFALASGACREDNADALCHHEVLLPGHLLTIFFKEQCATWLGGWKRYVEGQIKPPQRGVPQKKKSDTSKLDLNDAASIRRATAYMKDVGKGFSYLLATGNLVSLSGLDLPQQTGFTVVADKLNYFRYVSHFRSIHRGAYFAELRTTTVRKLLPESWGFVCPVHTPDGSPCGLLLHLTRACTVVCDGGKPNAQQRSMLQQAAAHPERSNNNNNNDDDDDDDDDDDILDYIDMPDNAKMFIMDRLLRVLYECGMAPIESSKRGTLAAAEGAADHLRVVVDGQVVGTIPTGEVAEQCERALRALKAASYAGERLQERLQRSGEPGAYDEALAEYVAEMNSDASALSSVSRSQKERRGADWIHARRFEAAMKAVPAWATNELSGTRVLKPECVVPPHMEVVHLGVRRGEPYPTLALFTEDARFVRPVLQMPADWSERAAAAKGPPPPEHLPVELIGSLESTHLLIACPHGKGTSDAGGMDTNRAKDAAKACASRIERWVPEPGSSHREVDALTPLSFIASLTPWSDRNQSPRNMYQTQMGKQTMGYPSHTLPYRNDSKMYKVHYPQSPVCRNTEPYSQMACDEYPLGFNAVVAVISYTGYDMEDAMILNKGSVDRGLAHGTLHKTEVVSLGTVRDEMRTRRGTSTFGTSGAPGGRDRNLTIQEARQRRERRGCVLDKRDGLPNPGTKLHGGESMYSMDYRTTSAPPHLHQSKGADPCVVDSVAIVGSELDGVYGPRRAAIRMRYDRNPIIGDKFSSRHGQKGTLSKLWPEEDMPFSERTGMRPDLIINPHAFPSRMTIGMLIESMAGKAGALHGTYVDSTPFLACDVADGVRQDEGGDDDPLAYRDPADVAADKLASLGFSRGGKETFVSGHSGEVLEADIFVGIVYYQRLRHMVSDKYQVRSVGAVNPLTRQPVKGRKMGGGIRFGEMERDALLSHGCAYLLHDRLHTSSDYHIADVCSLCGGLLSAHAAKPASVAGSAASGAALGSAAALASAVVASADAAAGQRPTTCRVCGTERGVVRVAMPYVFRYLAAELAAMNVKLTLVCDTDDQK